MQNGLSAVEFYIVRGRMSAGLPREIGKAIISWGE
jgi:hypothetical protein